MPLRQSLACCSICQYFFIFVVIFLLCLFVNILCFVYMSKFCYFVFVFQYLLLFVYIAMFSYAFYVNVLLYFVYI